MNDDDPAGKIIGDLTSSMIEGSIGTEIRSQCLAWVSKILFNCLRDIDIIAHRMTVKKKGTNRNIWKGDCVARF